MTATETLITSPIHFTSSLPWKNASFNHLIDHRSPPSEIRSSSQKSQRDMTTKMLMQSGGRNPWISSESAQGVGSPGDLDYPSTLEAFGKEFIEDTLGHHHLSPQQQKQLKEKFSQLTQNFSQEMEVLFEEVPEELKSSSLQENRVDLTNIAVMVQTALFEAISAHMNGLGAIGEANLALAKTLEALNNENLSKMKEHMALQEKQASASWIHKLIHKVVGFGMGLWYIAAAAALFVGSAGSAVVQASAMVVAGVTHLVTNIASSILDNIEMDPQKRAQIQLRLAIATTTIDAACMLVCPICKGLSVLAGKLGCFAIKRALNTVNTFTNMHHTVHILIRFTTVLNIISTISTGGVTVVKHSADYNVVKAKLPLKRLEALLQLHTKIQNDSVKLLETVNKNLMMNMNLFTECMQNTLKTTFTTTRNIAA